MIKLFARRKKEDKKLAVLLTYLQSKGWQPKVKGAGEDVEILLDSEIVAPRIGPRKKQEEKTPMVTSSELDALPSVTVLPESIVEAKPEPALPSVPEPKQPSEKELRIQEADRKIKEMEEAIKKLKEEK
jgi:hypothetical protein